MSNFISVNTPGGQIWVEVDESIESRAPELTSASEKAFRNFEQTVTALKKNALFIIKAMEDLAPTEIEATFGITAGVEAGVPLFGLAKASGEASYTVKLKWELGSSSKDSN